MTMVEELFQQVGSKTSTIARLAEKSGVPYPTIMRWSKRQASPRIDLFIALANAAGFELELVPKEKKMNKPKPIKLVTRSVNRIEAYLDNAVVGYVENDTLFAIDAKGFASEVGPINHRVEIADKLIMWRKQNHVV